MYLCTYIHTYVFICINITMRSSKVLQVFIKSIKVPVMSMQPLLHTCAHIYLLIFVRISRKIKSAIYQRYAKRNRYYVHRYIHTYQCKYSMVLSQHYCEAQEEGKSHEFQYKRCNSSLNDLQTLTLSMNLLPTSFCTSRQSHSPILEKWRLPIHKK